MNVDNFTAQPTAGYFNGQAEKSIAIEIVYAKRKNVDGLGRDIRKINGQKSLPVMSLSGSAKEDRMKPRASLGLILYPLVLRTRDRIQ